MVGATSEPAVVPPGSRAEPGGRSSGDAPGPRRPAAGASEDPGEPAESDTGEPIPRPEFKSAYGNPAAYEQFGQTYHVLPTSKGYVAEGVASWYGEPFHGRRTSSGETYDMNLLTAAHRTLPLPTFVRVTNLENGRTLVLRVNDRGPFHDVETRIIDVSLAAAQRLGMVESGTARVRVRALDPPARDRPPNDPAPSRSGPERRG